MIMINIDFIFNFTKLIILGILFSPTVRAAVVVAKLVTLGILFLTSFIWALRAVVANTLSILDIPFLT